MKHLLALDGGGLYGLISLGLLEAVERRLVATVRRSGLRAHVQWPSC